MLQASKYKGHSIAIGVHPVGCGRWTWAYAVDDGARQTCCLKPLKSRQFAYDEALVDAEMLIDGNVSARGP